MKTALDYATTLWMLAALAGIALWAVGARFGYRTLLRARPRPNLLQLWHVLLVLAASLLLAIVSMSVMAVLGLIRTSPGEVGKTVSVGVLWGNIVGALLSLGVALYIAAMTFDGGLAGFGLSARKLGRRVGWGVLCILTILPLSLIVTNVVNYFVEKTGQEPQVHPILKALAESPSPSMVIAMGLMAVVVAPVIEEVIYRGIVQSFLVRFLRVMMPPKGWPTMALWIVPPEVRQAQAQAAVARARALGEQPPVDLEAPWPPESAGGQAAPLSPSQHAVRAMAAILLSSLLFTAIHIPLWTNLPGLFILALGLGYAYERTGSLIAPITMHVLFNGFSFAITLWQAQTISPTTAPSSAPSSAPAIGWLIGLFG